MDTNGHNAWQRFWNRGGWWRAVLAAAGYIALYLLFGFLVTTVFAGAVDRDNPLGTPISVFVAVALPILIGSIVLLVFAATLGWLPGLFRRHHGPAPKWMWGAVVLVLIPAILRLAATHWSGYTITLVLAILFVGLCVGFAEEFVTRGLAVELMRRGGHSERFVYILSSVLFGLLHATNLTSGQNPVTVLVTVVYAMGFGAMMYLSLRVTRWLFAVMLLHAITDPTTILVTGGIDTATNLTSTSPLATIAGAFGVIYIVVGLIAIPFVRGRVEPTVEIAGSGIRRTSVEGQH